MASEGPRYPGTTASLANAGTSENANAWLTPGNIVSDNGSEAQITAATYDSPDISEILVASNFGFTAPVGTIDGITVEIDRRSIIASSGKDFRVQLAKGTTFADLVGSNLAVPATIWPTTSGIATYGGASNLWGATWDASDITASSFAVFLSCQANIANADIGVDFIRVTVHYTEPSGASGTASWEQAAATWDAAASEEIPGSAAFVQAPATWAATADHSIPNVDATAAFVQAPATWDAVAETPPPVDATASWVQAAAGWAATASEEIPGTAAFEQAPATWAATASESIPGTAAFVQEAASWAASGSLVTPITGTASWAQAAATWAAVGSHEYFDPTQKVQPARIAAPGTPAAGGLAKVDLAPIAPPGAPASGGAGKVTQG